MQDQPDPWAAIEQAQKIIQDYRAAESGACEETLDRLIEVLDRRDLRRPSTDT